MSIRHDRDLRYRKTRNNNTFRPKSFKTEESAKAYAKAQGIEKYTLRNLRSEDAQRKKIIIEQE